MSDYKTYEVRVYDDGAMAWLVNGKLHREDGPAYEYADGKKEWWLNGKPLTEDEFNARNNSSCEGRL